MSTYHDRCIVAFLGCYTQPRHTSYKLSTTKVQHLPLRVSWSLLPPSTEVIRCKDNKKKKNKKTHFSFIVTVIQHFGQYIWRKHNIGAIPLSRPRTVQQVIERFHSQLDPIPAFKYTFEMNDIYNCSHPRSLSRFNNTTKLPFPFHVRISRHYGTTLVFALLLVVQLTAAYIWLEEVMCFIGVSSPKCVLHITSASIWYCPRVGPGGLGKGFPFIFANCNAFE
jgi:hypothetical protein